MKIEIQSGGFEELAHELREVRTAVFIREQRVPWEIEMDERDASCIHVLARADGRPVGTARIDLEKDGKVGRVAVLRDYRRCGIGRRLMAELESIAGEYGLQRLWFHAQTSAIPFYEQIGYSAEGPEFSEAGIPHRTMSRRLGP